MQAVLPDADGQRGVEHHVLVDFGREGGDLLGPELEHGVVDADGEVGEEKDKDHLIRHHHLH